jgi:hypothetical protein
MLYLLFILVLVALIFAVVWLGTRAKEAKTEDAEDADAEDADAEGADAEGADAEEASTAGKPADPADPSP